MTDHTAHRTGWRITTRAACAAEYADPLRPVEADHECEWFYLPDGTGECIDCGKTAPRRAQDLTDGAKHAIGVYLAVSGLLLALALPLLVLFAVTWKGYRP